MKYVKLFESFVNDSKTINEAGIPKMYVKYMAVVKKIRELEDAQKELAQPYFKAREEGNHTAMVNQMDAEGFGACTNTGACAAECPKQIPLSVIANKTKSVLSFSNCFQTSSTLSGVTTIVPVIDPPVPLTVVKLGKSPNPLAPKPIAVFEFVHANVAPAGVLTNPFIGTAAPAQNVWFGSAVITGTGFTVIV